MVLLLAHGYFNYSHFKKQRGTQHMYFLIFNFSTFNFCYASNRRNVHELIDKSLTINFCQDSSLIIISQSSAHRLVVHVWFVLVETPQPGHGLAVDDLEDPPVPVQPLDVPGTVGGGLEETEQELPEVGVVAVLGSPLDRPAWVWVETMGRALTVELLVRRRWTSSGEGGRRREVRKVLR